MNFLIKNIKNDTCMDFKTRKVNKESRDGTTKEHGWIIMNSCVEYKLRRKIEDHSTTFTVYTLQCRRLHQSPSVCSLFRKKGSVC
jgi:hypothetical protein